MKSFQQTLKIGEKFEREYVFDALRQVVTPTSIIIPTHDYQLKTNSKFAGPRMHLPDGRSVVLPDFECILPNGDVHFYEAKFKKKPTTANGYACYCIEESKCRQYEEATTLKNAELFYIFGDGKSNEIRLYKADQFRGTITYNNQFTYNRPVVNRCFALDDGVIIGSFNG